MPPLVARQRESVQRACRGAEADTAGSRGGRKGGQRGKDKKQANGTVCVHANKSSQARRVDRGVSKLQTCILGVQESETFRLQCANDEDALHRGWLQVGATDEVCVSVSMFACHAFDEGLSCSSSQPDDDDVGLGWRSKRGWSADQPQSQRRPQGWLGWIWSHRADGVVCRRHTIHWAGRWRATNVVTLHGSALAPWRDERLRGKIGMSSGHACHECSAVHRIASQQQRSSSSGCACRGKREIMQGLMLC